MSEQDASAVAEEIAPQEPSVQDSMEDVDINVEEAVLAALGEDEATDEPDEDEVH